MTACVREFVSRATQFRKAFGKQILRSFVKVQYSAKANTAAFSSYYDSHILRICHRIFLNQMLKQTVFSLHLKLGYMTTSCLYSTGDFPKVSISNLRNLSAKYKCVSVSAARIGPWSIKPSPAGYALLESCTR